jgi:hypothetical protein
MTVDPPFGGEPTDLTLSDVLAAAAEDLPDVTAAATADGTTTWSRGGAPFAVLADAGAEFRLDPLVARAALRTPETQVSIRGADWIVFAPAILDEGAVDRAEAWFLSAYRRTSARR